MGAAYYPQVALLARQTGHFVPNYWVNVGEINAKCRDMLLFVSKHLLLLKGFRKTAGTTARRIAPVYQRQIPDQPGVAHKVFSPLSDAGIVVDMIIQNDSQRSGHTDLTFTVPTADRARTLALIEEANKRLGGSGIESDADIAKVSVVGVGMRTHSGVATRMFEVLSEAGINIQMISTSEIKISVVIAEERTEKAVQALHAAFKLDALA